MNTLDQLKEIISNIAPDTDVTNTNTTRDSKLVEDLGFDSLSMMMLAMEIENTYNFQFDEVTDFITVGDVIDYIERNKK